MEDSGRDLAYTTVATLVRILNEKGSSSKRSKSAPLSFSRFVRRGLGESGQRFTEPRLRWFS
ncbi:MAG: hypothetical protein ACKVHE_17065 [Planctomycetales bacterium]